MSLFTKVKCKYYFQKKVDNKALSKSGRQTQLLRSTETYSRTFCQASLTVEAAVVLPLFIGFMVFLLFYFRIMQTELAVEQAMMYTARVEAACVSKSSDTVHPAKVQLHFLKSAKEEKVPFEYIDGEKAGISFRKSDYEGTELMLHASYRMTIPIGFFGTLRYPAEQEVSARKWIGYIPQEEGAGEKKLVYVTKTGKAYHSSRECAYLDLSIRTVSLEEVESSRNKNGSKYVRCGSCCKKKSGKTCYITDYGTCYHVSLECRGLKRTVYVISLDKVGKRHPCKKCT